jgi:hypothetical protein
MYADLLQLVGWRLLSGDFSDYVRFRAVCRHWRSSTDSPSGRGIIDARFRPRRWMMLPDSHGLHPRDGKRRFFNLSLGSFICCRVPLLQDHTILCTVEGLLLVQRLTDDVDGTTVRLLHPFTGDVAKFPPITYHTICLALTGYRLRDGHGRHNLLPSSVTAALSVGADGVPAIMIMLSDVSRVLFATTGDKQWRFSAWSLCPKWGTVSSQGKLYVLQNLMSAEHDDDGELRILQIDPPPRHEGMSGYIPYLFPAPKVIAVCPSSMLRRPFNLVECDDSEVLLIGYDDAVLSKRVIVYRVDDLVLGSVVPLTSIRGNALLIDIPRSLSVGSKAMPLIMGDTVVRRDPMCDKSLQQYHLGTATWSSRAAGCDEPPAADGPCLCNLLHHIYGACHCAVTR